MSPEVSIILPVFNAGAQIGEALARLERTRLSTSELLIVDDGSTDDTLEHLEAFAASRTWVQLIPLQSNHGVAHARNTALARSQGEYVWFVDWDDDWDTDILTDLYRLARRDDADVVITGSRWMLPGYGPLRRVESLPPAGIITGASALDHLLREEICGYLWSKLFRRSLLPDDMFPAMVSQSDFCGIVPVLATCGRIVIDPTIRYFHVMRAGSITNSKNPRLENLRRCQEVMTRTVEKSAPDPAREDLLLRYTYKSWYLATVHTSSKRDPLRTATLQARGE